MRAYGSGAVVVAVAGAPAIGVILHGFDQVGEHGEKSSPRGSCEDISGICLRRGLLQSVTGPAVRTCCWFQQPQHQPQDACRSQQPHKDAYRFQQPQHHPHDAYRSQQPQHAPCRSAHGAENHTGAMHSHKPHLSGSSSSLRRTRAAHVRISPCKKQPTQESAHAGPRPVDDNLLIASASAPLLDQLADQDIRQLLRTYHDQVTPCPNKTHAHAHTHTHLVGPNILLFQRSYNLLAVGHSGLAGSQLAART